MLYLEGSILFTIGGAFQFFASYAGVTLSANMAAATVTTPYFVGSIAFTLGAWAGMESLLRMPSLRGSGRPRVFLLATKEHWRMMYKAASWQAFVAYLAYFIGAVCFNVNCICSFYALRRTAEELLVWVPAVLGSLGFAVGGCIECHRNAVVSTLRQVGLRGTAAVWISLCNGAGGILFFLAAFTGALLLPGETGEAVDHWMSVGSYFLGSVLFLVGALIGVWMWKCEHYGLGLIPELNLEEHTSESGQPEEYERHNEVLSQYGCGRSSTSQLPWLLVYLLNASASVLEVALALQPYMRDNTIGDAQRVLDGLLNFALSHGVVALASVIHHVPSAAPHSWLLRYMRAVLLLYTANTWFTVHALLQQLLAQEAREMPPSAPPSAFPLPPSPHLLSM